MYAEWAKQRRAYDDAEKEVDLARQKYEELVLKPGTRGGTLTSALSSLLRADSSHDNIERNLRRLRRTGATCRSAATSCC
ncbi:g854 [Coccomyxa elongata]